MDEEVKIDTPDEVDKDDVENTRKSMEKFLDFCKNEYDRVTTNIRTLEERIRNNTLFATTIITAVTVIRKPDPQLDPVGAGFLVWVFYVLAAVMLHQLVLLGLSLIPTLGIKMKTLNALNSKIREYAYEDVLEKMHDTYLGMLPAVKKHYQYRRTLQLSQSFFLTVLLGMAVYYVIR